MKKIVSIAKKIKADIHRAKKIEAVKKNAVKNAAKARRFLKKIIKTKNKVL